MGKEWIGACNSVVKSSVRQTESRKVGACL